MRSGGSIRWRGVGAGALAAALTVFLLSPMVRGLYDILTGSLAPMGKLTSGLIVVALVSGFLAYLFGGFVAGRLARGAGGANGAMTAVMGTAVGALLGAVGIAVSGNVWVAIMNLGSAGLAVLIGLLLLLIDLFGGYIGGKLGEPSEPRMHRLHD
ncbi:MAG TPA: hypothetical protein VFJ72_02815 [Rubrobacteraceae bacterium]|nr:hypothetical protein [Rubrobacteraceae bacterium]